MGHAERTGEEVMRVDGWGQNLERAAEAEIESVEKNAPNAALWCVFTRKLSSLFVWESCGGYSLDELMNSAHPASPAA